MSIHHRTQIRTPRDDSDAEYQTTPPGVQKCRPRRTLHDTDHPRDESHPSHHNYPAAAPPLVRSTSRTTRRTKHSTPSPQPPPKDHLSEILGKLQCGNRRHLAPITWSTFAELIATTSSGLRQRLQTCSRGQLGISRKGCVELGLDVGGASTGLKLVL